MKPSHAANYLVALAQSLPAVFTTTAAMLVSVERAQERNRLSPASAQQHLPESDPLFEEDE